MYAREDCVNRKHSYYIIKLLILTVLSIYVALTHYIHLIFSYLVILLCLVLITPALSHPII